MQFLSDVYVMCEECLGKRFQAVPLEVTFRGKNAHDWLETTVDECSTLLHSESKVREAAETLSRLGLGHLRLGHSLSDLSGGEAQRLKLVPFIQQSQKGNSLLFFDEPTTGLHLEDVRRLLGVLQDLTLLGHTVVCVEHNQELILSSDWIIDLGPEGGANGGELLLEGTPTTFLKTGNASKSYTAKYLQSYQLQNRGQKRSTNAAKELRTTKPKGPQPLTIRGAREHNLKNIFLSLPHNKVIALTGVSGSGKSTIAKDIIYSEGQRRYLDCLSPYARQFIRELEKPDIDEVTNLRPTICVYQHTFQPGKLSTLGTMSEVYSFLRLLYAKLGQQYCPDHLNERVNALSSEEIAHQISTLGNEEVRLLAPIIKGRKGLHKSVFQRAIQSDISEVRVDGTFASPSHFLDGLERAKTHSIDFVWGKIVPARVPRQLLQEGIEEIFALGGGVVIVHTKDSETLYSRERACPVCQRGVYRPDPEDLSFHSKRGRCEKCEGVGTQRDGTPCPACDGTRLKPFGRSVRIGDLDIGALSRLNATQAKDYFTHLTWTENERHVAEPVLREVESRLDSLCELGLDYLPLNRSCTALSQGELQRLRLAAALGTPLSGAMYIFDEPSAGLHPQDNHRILSKFQELRDARNTVMLIEHDEESIASADYVVEVGPGAGQFGGTITFEGPQENFPGVSIENIPSQQKTKNESCETLSL
ncbi:MAG: hypothetical protein KDD55_11850, partial [Bdellovibrionales bacterium]|nr:hypothetical protein [Bdellovibrionales bacterium]